MYNTYIEKNHEIISYSTIKDTAMKIDYEQLIETIYQKGLVDMLSSDSFELIKQNAVLSIFEEDIKPSFDATSLKLGGHNNNLFNRYTLKKLENNSSFEAENMFSEIKEKVMFALSFIIDSVYNAIKNQEKYATIKVKTLILAEKLMSFKVSKYCSVCGQDSHYQMSNGSIYESNKKCPFPKGIEPFTQYMPVQSNRLVFANHFEDLFNVEPLLFRDHIAQHNGEYNSINSELGAMYEQQHQLNNRLLQVLVSYTTPVIAQHEDSGMIMVVSSEAWHEKESYKFPISPDGFNVVGQVDNAPRVVQVIDSYYVEKYVSQHGMSFEEFLERYEAFAVPVTPGTYSITNYNAHNYDDIKPVFFSLKKI
jgi:hypothetical protein